MHKPIRILTIEDEQAVRESIVAYLEDSGFEMLQAENGRRGIELVERERPDLVLCDLRMPEVDGLQVLANVTQEQPETPVIIVSGTGVIADAIEALKLGAWDFITKPIEDMAVLEHAVLKSLERARLLRENREYRDHLEAMNKELRRSLRRLEEEVEAGRRIQFQLLPERRADFGPYEFRSLVLPSTYLSGDFLDYFEIDSRHIGFYIADVSGHGVSSAFVTVLLKSFMSQLLDAHAAQGDMTILRPAEVLRRLNADIVQRDLGKYLTMFYAVVDVERGEVADANGGQYPAPILVDGAAPRFLEAKTHPVGLFPEAAFEEERVTLPTACTLALFSDGILDVLPQEDIADKEQSLLGAAAEMDGDLDGTIARIRTDNMEDPPDDITLLLMTKRG